MRKPVLSCTALLSVVVALSLIATPALAADRYELVLENRSYVPAEVKLAREVDSHLVVQFYEIPTAAEREELAASGITLLDYLPNYAWTAHVRGGALQLLEPGVVRAAFELRAEDKIRRSATGQEVVRAFVYDGVTDAESVLSGYGTIIDQDGTGYTLILDVEVAELASDDIVKCVAGPRPEKALHNDELRDNINADEVQVAPYNLDGTGLYAGIWDGGAVASNHDDFNGRLTFGDGASTHYHATKCAGIMAGDGSRSSAEGGSAYQWRGVATEVDIVSYDWPYDVADMDAENSAAISTYDIVVSSNSWGWGLCPDYCEYYGEYDDWSQNYDKLVRGSAGKKLTVVFSAGNDGNCNQCSGDIPDYPYGTIPGPGSTSKNAIVVGSNNADNDALSSYSSMGPTLDGRLKPDVAAPGCKSYEGIKTTYLYNDYDDGGCGTSYSCPAVSGSVILAQEDYIDKFGGEAWPSTMKALMIQGAEDQGNVGPDFQFGYGRINIQNTIDIIRADDGTSDLIKEDTLSPAETWEYDISVTPGEDLRVTLAWDDYQGDWGAGGTMLVNDLDLELEAPGGSIYEPWVLNPSSPANNATTGDDHLNNVEQVEVSSPTPGTWTIRVTATVMPEANQDFSVVTNFAGGAVDPPPAEPTGLDAVPGSGEGEIDVSWNANSEPDFDHYRLERATNSSFSGAVSFTTGTNSYDDSGLAPGDTYWYRVFAVDAGSNESGASGSDSAIATDLPPAAPTGLNAITGSGEGEIDVSWNANAEPDFDHYRLQRATNPSFSGVVSFTMGTNSYDDSGLTPDDTYWYRVYAVDAGGNESSASGSDSAVAEDLPPAAPTGLDAATGAGEGEIDITWNASGASDFDHYRLERADNPSFSGSTSFTTTSTSYDDSGLTPDDRYYYRVYAVDNGGNESAASASDSARAGDLPPAAPTGLAAATGAAEGEIDVTWDPSGESDFDHYRLERADNPSFVGATSFTMAATSFGDSGLTPGDTYHYRVYAIDAGDNESGASASDSAVALDLPPAPPAGLVALTGSAEGEIDISWSVSPEPDFDRYRLERSLAPDFEPGSEPFEGAVASYTDTGLTPGELYYYRVYAIDDGGNVSPPSNVDTANAQDLAPATPTGLTVLPGADEGEIDVSWDANSEGDFDHYRLERHTDPGFGPGSDPFDTPATFFPDSGLVPGDPYYYRVIAVDVAGNESAPSDVEFAAATDLAPAPPTGLVALTGSAEGEIDISWSVSPEPDIDRYRVERSLAPDFEPGSEPFEEPAVSFTDTGLIPGELYYYRVYAIDANDNVSAPSAVDSAIALDLAPGAPTGLTADPGTNEGDIDLSWDANPEGDIDHYVLERDADPGFGSPDSYVVSGTTYADAGLPLGVPYYYRVFAVDAGTNTSDASAPASSYPRDLPPGAPTGLSAVTGPVEGGIDVSWAPNPEPDVDHYRLERDEDAGFTSPTSIGGIYGTSYSDSGLTPGGTYHYRVFAVDQSMTEGPPSNIDSAVALDLAPAAPTGLAAVEGVSEGDVDVSWDANGELDLDHYRVERDTSALFGPATVLTDENGTSLLDIGLGPDTYFYRVFAVDANGLESGASDTVSITLEQTGIGDELVAAVSFIRPNPFTTQTSIHYSVPTEGAAVTLRLYDIRGRLVRTLIDRDQSGGAHQAAWDGRDSNGATVASGVYFARVSIGDWGETRKIAYVR